MEKVENPPINEDLNVTIYETDNIKNLIYNIRGKQVMLDSDVAMLYNYKTKRVNETVMRNKSRFPEEFCFQLTKREFENLRSQFATSSLDKDNYGGRRYLPYVFTEQGIAMLSGLLKNDVAIQISIKIMNAFVEMRHFLINNGQVFQRLSNVENRLTGIDYKLSEHDKKFNQVFDALKESKEEQKQQIFFEGQIWDAYNLIINLIKRANEKILIIDNYVDDSILEMLSKKKEKVEVVILTSEKSNILKLDIQKFNKEYPTLKVAKTNKFHDRFIVIDDKEIYHCGASIKDLGNKCFAINKIEDTNIIKYLTK